MRLFRRGPLHTHDEDYVVVVTDTETIWSYEHHHPNFGQSWQEIKSTLKRGGWTEIPLTREIETGLRLLQPEQFYKFVTDRQEKS